MFDEYGVAPRSGGASDETEALRRMLSHAEHEAKFWMQEKLEARLEVHALRALLARRIGGCMLYDDDGEMQDNSVAPFIDFKRDSPDEISHKLRVREEEALISGQALLRAE